MSKQTLKAQINDDMAIIVRAVDDNVNLKDEFFAINWFNHYRPILYNIYLWLAVPVVEKIGGRMIFKGKIHRVLDGDTKGAREMLVIVKYPGVPEFLKLFDIKKFRLYSLIRNNAVKQFLFGFTKNVVDNDVQKKSVWNDDPQVAYLLHHFQCEGDNEQKVKDLINNMEIKGVVSFFAGLKIAEIGRQVKRNEPRFINLFDGLLLFEASNPEAMQALLNNPEHKAFRNSNSENFLSIFKREA